MKKVILYAEDNPEDRDAFRKIKDAVNGRFSLITFENGQEILSYLKGDSPYENRPLPALIFADLYMPHLSGKEILLQLKKNLQWTGNPPVVIMTGVDLDRPEIEELYSLGAASISRKDCFEEVVSYWLQNVQI